MRLDAYFTKVLGRQKWDWREALWRVCGHVGEAASGNGAGRAAGYLILEKYQAHSSVALKISISVEAERIQLPVAFLAL